MDYSPPQLSNIHNNWAVKPRAEHRPRRTPPLAPTNGWRHASARERGNMATPRTHRGYHTETVLAQNGYAAGARNTGLCWTSSRTTRWCWTTSGGRKDWSTISKRSSTPRKPTSLLRINLRSWIRSTRFLSLGAMRRGIGLLQKASKLAPASPSVRLDLAKALIRAGQKMPRRRNWKNWRSWATSSSRKRTSRS
jgi:hypothetical protein